MGLHEAAAEGRTVPAPWTVHGRGYVFFFRLPMETTSPHSKYAEDPHNLVTFAGGLGLLALADYRDSPVGPYKELVFVPGRYQYHDIAAGVVKKAHGISRIWVDNERSVTNGRVNWSVPKESAVFQWREPSPSQAGRVTVRRPSRDGCGGDVIFDVAISDRYSPVSLPFRTKVPFLPVDALDFVPLVQLPVDDAAAGGVSDGAAPELVKTTCSLRGWVKPAAMTERPRVDASALPSVGALYGLSIRGFEMQSKAPLKLRMDTTHLHKVISDSEAMCKKVCLHLAVQ